MMNEDEHGLDAMQKCGTWAIHFDVHTEGEVSDSGGWTGRGSHVDVQTKN